MQQLIFSEEITGNFLIRLLLAGLLGAALGLERDIHGRAAGLRTNLLVSLGAALFMIISEAVALAHAKVSGESILRSDPGRIAAQIITGIGFLGAGAIIKEGFSIRGLTTAACLWITAGIGMASGAGFFELAIVVTGIALITLVLLNKFEKLYAKDSYRTLEIITQNDTDLSRIIEIVKRKNLKILYLDYERHYEKNWMVIVFSIRLFHKGVTDKLSHTIIQDLETSGYSIQKIR